MKVGDKFRCIQEETIIFESDIYGSIKEGEIYELIEITQKKYRFKNTSNGAIFYVLSSVMDDIFFRYFEPIRVSTNQIKLTRNPGCYNAQDSYRPLKVGEVITWETETPTEYLYREWGNIVNWVDKRDAEPFYE